MDENQIMTEEERERNRRQNDILCMFGEKIKRDIVDKFGEEHEEEVSKIIKTYFNWFRVTTF
jgi:hypothetical protein